jgi:alkylhydroperoxidase/carboxymuconolactone decarboxylase family protein YurZ
MVYLPRPFTRFREAHREVWDAYETLAERCHQGPLEERERELVKLGVAIGAQAEGAVKSHVRRALDCGYSQEQVEHAVVLALTTAGFPHMIAAREWAHEVFASHNPGKEGGIRAR